MTMNDIGLMEFIGVLRENRCLWDPRDASYTNRTVRTAAQMALLNIFQKYDTNANLASVRRKIHYIRAAYLRERRKIQANEIAGSMSNETYVPTLWYYDQLNFLSEVYKVAKPGADSPDPLVYSFLEDGEEERLEFCQQQGDDATEFRTPPSKDLKRKRMSAQKQLITATEKLTNNSETGTMDSWEAYGFSVGGDLRNLGSKQQTIAQKLISDVIFFAKMGRLSKGSTVVDTPLNMVSSSPSASSVLSPTSPPCNASGPLSPYHDVPASSPQASIPESSKYSPPKNNGQEMKYYCSNQSANDPFGIPTNQQQPEHAPLSQDLQGPQKVSNISSD